MKSFLGIIIFAFTLLSAQAQNDARIAKKNTPQDRAAALAQEHDRNLRIWNAKMNKAQTQQELDILVAKRPNTKAYSEALLKTINPYLRKDWSVKYMAWLLRNHPNLMLVAENSNAGHTANIDREDIFMQYFELHHIESPDAGEFVLSLTGRINPRVEVETRKRRLAEMVVKKNPHEKNIGLGSLANALLLPVSKTDNTLKRRKLAMFKTAINYAADEKVGELSVSKLISEELYRMNHLEEGCPVPLFKGRDATDLEHSIVDYKGRVVMLVFWTQNQEKSQDIADRMNLFVEKHKGEKFALIGVTGDSVSSVRKLRAEQKISWRNIFDKQGKIFKQFRVKQTPYCYIINKRGHICYGGVFGGWNDSQVLAAVLQEK